MPDETTKHARASTLLKELWEHQTGVLSLQALQEFYVTVTQKIEQPISASEATQVVKDYLAAWEVVAPTAQTLLTALEAQQKYQLHFWDALILAAATEAGAVIVYTEDFQHGRTVEGIRFINPFQP